MAVEKKKIGIFEKLKAVKHIEVIVLVVFAACLLLIMFNSFGTDSKTTSTDTDLNTYAKNMETRLSEVLSKIDGAGKVSVMINFESGVEIVPAMETDSNDNTKIVLVGGKPIIITEIQPKVSGVIIVAEGASNIKVKLELYKAVQTLLGIEQNTIEIFTMTSNK